MAIARRAATGNKCVLKRRDCFFHCGADTRSKPPSMYVFSPRFSDRKPCTSDHAHRHQTRTRTLAHPHKQLHAYVKLLPCCKKRASANVVQPRSTFVRYCEANEQACVAPVELLIQQAVDRARISKLGANFRQREIDFEAGHTSIAIEFHLRHRKKNQKEENQQPELHRYLPSLDMYDPNLLVHDRNAPESVNKVDQAPRSNLSNERLRFGMSVARQVCESDRKEKVTAKLVEQRWHERTKTSTGRVESCDEWPERCLPMARPTVFMISIVATDGFP